MIVHLRHSPRFVSRALARAVTTLAARGVTRVIHEPSELPPAPSDPPRRVLAPKGITYTDHGPTALATGGPVIVALHGCPGSTFDWRWLGPGLEPHARLLRLDLPGHGDTPAAAVRHDPSPFAVAATVWEAVDALLSLRGHSGDDRVVLLGHSLGTEVAVAMADQRPSRVSALVLISPVGVRAHRAARPVPVVIGLARFSAAPALAPIMRPLMRVLYTRFLGFPPRVPTDEFLWCQQRIAARDFRRFGGAAAALWRRNRVPTLLTWALDDPLIEPAIFAELSAVVGEDSGPRVVFARGGHNLVKSHAKAISHAVVAWLRELGLGGDASGSRSVAGASFAGKLPGPRAPANEPLPPHL